MDNFEMTKIAGAVLSALLLIFGTKTLIEMNTGHHTDTAGYSLAAVEAPAETVKGEGGEEAKPEAGEAPAADAKPKDDSKAAEAAAPAGEAAPAGGGDEIVALLAKANADNGKAVFSKCKSCHVADKGKPSGVGPNLWGVVNRPKASYEGFKYSEAMKAKGGEWSFANLSAFLRNPKAYVAGTKMVFNGIASPTDEADLIAYLATLADAPVPLPK